MQGPVSAMIRSTKCASRFSPLLGVTSLLPSSSRPDPVDVTLSSVSDRFRPLKPKPVCLPLVLLKARRSSFLFFPCTLASLAMALSSSKRSREEASSRSLMQSSERSAKENCSPKDVSSDRSNSPGLSCAVVEVLGRSLDICRSITAWGRSAISL